jgi:hypothetical protein
MIKKKKKCLKQLKPPKQPVLIKKIEFFLLRCEKKKKLKIWISKWHDLQLITQIKKKKY